MAAPVRPGAGRIADSFKNISATGRAGTIFFVPGVDETLRINGRARLSQEPALLAGMAVDGKLPKLAIVLTVEEAYLHCAKALRRSKLWDPLRHQPRSVLPSLAKMIIDQTNRSDINLEDADARIEKAYRETLY